MKILLISKVRFTREMLHGRLVAAGHRQVVAVDFSSSPLKQVKQLPRLLFLISDPSDGIRTVLQFRTVHPATPIGVLAQGNGDDEFLAWTRLGISGYVEPDTDLNGIVAAIGRLVDGEIVYPARLSGLLLQHFASRDADSHRELGPDLLTPRELEVIELLADGKANKQIACRLAITGATVKNHVHNTLEKLSARSRSEAAAIYRRRGLARLDGRPSGRTRHVVPAARSLLSMEAD